MIMGKQGDLSKMLPMIALMGSLDGDDSSNNNDDDGNDFMNLAIVMKDDASVSKIKNPTPTDNQSSKSEVINDFKEYGGTVIGQQGNLLKVETYSNYGTIEIDKEYVQRDE